MYRLLAFALLAAGCASHADQVRDVRYAYFAGDLPMAAARIDANLKKHPRDADVLKLDRAMVLLFDNKPKEAEALLKEVRDHFDALEGKDAGEEMKAMLLDDRQRAYSGEDYEKVLIRFMLSLCNLMQDGGDAAAYALQVNQKQQQIIEQSKCVDSTGANLKANYKYVAAGAYLHAALREETHTNYDDVARSLEQVAKWQPEFQAVKADLERAKTGHHSQPNHGVVYVFAFVGAGPMKEEHAEVVSQASLLIADRLITALGKQSLPPTIAPIKVPLARQPHNTIQHAAVACDGKQAGHMEVLTNIGRMAEEQSAALLPETVARAVVRRVVKKGVVYGAKEAVHTDKTQLISLAMDIGGVAWEATEVADTRCWGLLPETIQVLRLELPVGEHVIDVIPIHGAGTNISGPLTSVKVQVANGRNSYVLAQSATTNTTCRVVVSNPK